MKKLIPYIIFSLSLSACGYNDFPPAPDIDPERLYPTMGLSTIREWTIERAVLLPTEGIIAGYVTANDRTGNFFQTLIISDNSCAVEIKAGYSYLHHVYSIGRYVAVKTGGLVAEQYNGMISIGPLVSTEFTQYAGEFEAEMYMDKSVFPADYIREIEPMPLTIAKLDKQLCGMLIKLDDLLWAVDPQTDSDTWADNPSTALGYPAQGNRYFHDPKGDSIMVQTSAYAHFAGYQVPRERVSLTGILMYGRTTARQQGFFIKLRSADDIGLE